jgi:hypothetical protein
LCGNLKERDHLEDTSIDGRIMLRWVFRKWCRGDIHWIDLALDGDRWQALENTVMILQVSLHVVNFLTS